MTNRELSEKLYKLACQLEEIVDGNISNTSSKRIITCVADELHDLSNENYTPGSTSWNDLKPNKPSKKQPYTNTAGKKLPF